ncbi:lipid-binding protein [Mucilaginibacter limnophilus]|uniref:Lipid-binding protein n=1 Tax=Mucilaginibacter limnophilus TaxID=1932778 RepID=A0A437MRY4_9SPHI|nr:START domain-containing protein [Mucilaginibacter limnophilus]RVU00412.1 lipid-binding protein [Mucilaginibacter limnophilus]
MAYTIIKAVIIITILSLITSHTFAQTDWKLKTEEDGIKVYLAPVSGSRVKAVKVECEYNAGPAALVAVLMDVKNCTEWVYHTKSCVLVKQVSPSELYYYSKISLPWPVENRDFVGHLTVSHDLKTHVITVDGPAVPGFVPEKKSIVRIANSKGRWTITPTGKNHIRVEYVLQVDPGGNLPAWLVNMFAAEGPIQSFKNLKLQVEKPQYQNAQLPSNLK